SWHPPIVPYNVSSWIGARIDIEDIVSLLTVNKFWSAIAVSTLRSCTRVYNNDGVVTGHAIRVYGSLRMHGLMRTNVGGRASRKYYLARYYNGAMRCIIAYDN